MHRSVIPLGGSESASLVLTSESVVAVDVPTMEATTVRLLVEKTVPVQERVADGVCVWQPVYDGLGARMAIPLPAVPAACTVNVVPDALLIPGRIRFVAVDATDTPVVQAAEKTLIVNCRRVR